MSALVTNARNRIAYNVARSLASKKIPVYAADFVPRSMSFASRHVKGHFVYPSPFRDPDAFVASLLEQIDRLRIDVLIPVFEETFLVAKHKDRFAPHVSMVVPDYDQVLVAHNKDRWEAVARAAGIRVPRTYSPDELRSGGARSRDIRYPVLIKPKQGGGSWGIAEAGSPAVLETHLAQPDWTGRSWDRFFVQEKIDGHAHCVAMLFNHGALRAKIGYRQLRDYPATGGQATLRVSIRHEQAERDLQALLEGLCWHGTCQADFIVDRDTGVPYLIDLNPRLWGSLAQAIASGVDFPHLIYRMAVDGDVTPVTAFQSGVITRWVGGELAALPLALRASQARLRFLREFLFPAKAAALFDDFSLSDPLPFVTWTLDAAHRAVRFRSTASVSHDSLDGVWE
jgi:predicted ATP-grasp superfamily ATP-dependent carboligase